MSAPERAISAIAILDSKGIVLKISRSSMLAATFMALASGAHADICDHTPSNLLSKSSTSVGSAITRAGSAAGASLKAADYYTLVHAGSGLYMLGSSASAASAAGAVGAILMAPATLIVGGITIIGVGAFEGVCYFQVERITDPYEVRRIIESVASQDDAVSIVATRDGDAMALHIAGETRTYLLRNLYIADGQLKYRSFGPNKTLGPILYSSAAVEE